MRIFIRANPAGIVNRLVQHRGCHTAFYRSDMKEMPQDVLKIIDVRSDDEVASAREIFEQYRSAHGGPDLEGEGIANEIATLPGRYSKPNGALLIACVGSEPAGCIALKRLDPLEGELKRLYVRPEYRGLGVGRALVTAILAEAWALGMERLRLDTLPSMVGAQALYAAHGFKPRASYGGKSSSDTLFFELRRKDLQPTADSRVVRR